MKRRDTRNRLCDFLRTAWICLATLLLGCATPPPATGPLEASMIQELDARARTPQQLGVQLTRRRQGPLRLVNAHAMSFGATTEVALLRADGPVTLPVHIGERRITAVIASGLSASVTDPHTARALGIVPIGHPLKRFGLTGPRAEHTAYMALSRTLRLGPLHIYNVPIGILNEQAGLPALWWLNPDEADLVLGHDFLRAFALVTFDFPARRLLAAHAETYQPRLDRLVSAVSMKRGFAEPVIDVMIDQEGPFPALIDTSLPLGLWMPRHMADMLSQPAPTPTTEGPRPYLAAGTVHLAVSGFNVTNLPFVVTAPAETGHDLPYAVLGTRAFRDHRLTLDFKTRKVYIERP